MRLLLLGFVCLCFDFRNTEHSPDCRNPEYENLCTGKHTSGHPVHEHSLQWKRSCKILTNTAYCQRESEARILALKRRFLEYYYIRKTDLNNHLETQKTLPTFQLDALVILRALLYSLRIKTRMVYTNLLKSSSICLCLIISLCLWKSRETHRRKSNWQWENNNSRHSHELLNSLMDWISWSCSLPAELKPTNQSINTAAEMQCKSPYARVLAELD